MGLGVTLPYPEARWYGEPPRATRDEFVHQARLMELGRNDVAALVREAHRAPVAPLRGRRPSACSRSIRADPRMAEVLIEGAEYLRCRDRPVARRREMIVKFDDFLRRRSKIALVCDREAMRNAPGLREACRLLFGAEADARFDEYFAKASA